MTMTSTMTSSCGSSKRVSNQQGSSPDLSTQFADARLPKQPREGTFPRDLLDQPVPTRLKYFEDKIIGHTIINSVLKEVMHAIRYPTKASMITVCGPTGVGKTTLVHKIIQQIIEDLANGCLTAGSTQCPPIMLEVPAPDSGYFRWRDFHERLLSELDRLLDDKLKGQGFRRNSEGQLVIGREITETALRRIVEECLRGCRPPVLIADEGHHFAKLPRGSQLVDQMDVIKSLASLAQTRLLLTGTYELLSMINLNGQGCRRSVDIHFRRYRYDTEDDRKAFKIVIQTFQRNLPFPNPPDLVGAAEQLYEGSLGCIGVLKDWLHRGAAGAMEANQSTLNYEGLERYALSTDKLIRMAREIREGEKRWETSEAQRKDLRNLLGMDAILDR